MSSLSYQISRCRNRLVRWWSHISRRLQRKKIKHSPVPQRPVGIIGPSRFRSEVVGPTPVLYVSQQAYFDIQHCSSVVNGMVGVVERYGDRILLQKVIAVPLNCSSCDEFRAFLTALSTDNTFSPNTLRVYIALSEYSNEEYPSIFAEGAKDFFITGELKCDEDTGLDTMVFDITLGSFPGYVIEDIPWVIDPVPTPMSYTGHEIHNRVLLLDDQEHRAIKFLWKYPGAHWVKTASECIAALASQSWDEVFLDRDLADSIFPARGWKGDGMEVVQWLVTYQPVHLTPTIFTVHSMNNGTGSKMAGLLREHGYTAHYRPYHGTFDGLDVDRDHVLEKLQDPDIFYMNDQIIIKTSEDTVGKLVKVVEALSQGWEKENL